MNFRYPRANSAAYNALRALHLAGSPVSLTDWMKHSSWTESEVAFIRSASAILSRMRLVCFADGQFSVTETGLEVLGVPPDAPPVAPAPIVSPPYRGDGIKPLNLARHFPARALREDSLSYRDIPSRMGDVRIDYTGGTAR